MSNVLEFPTQPRVEQFQSQKAVSESIRIALGAACGVFHRDPTEAEYERFFEHMAAAFELAKVHRTLKAIK
jgi:hypothetical protein